MSKIEQVIKVKHALQGLISNCENLDLINLQDIIATYKDLATSYIVTKTGLWDYREDISTVVKLYLNLLSNKGINNRSLSKYKHEGIVILRNKDNSGLDYNDMYEAIDIITRIMKNKLVDAVKDKLTGKDYLTNCKDEFYRYIYSNKLEEMCIKTAITETREEYYSKLENKRSKLRIGKPDEVFPTYHNLARNSSLLLMVTKYNGTNGSELLEKSLRRFFHKELIDILFN